MFNGGHMDQAKFQVTFDGEDQGVCGIAELVEANAEGAPELCDWMRGAKVGETRVEGGGASPVVLTKRVE
jgi:hypothetical protein